MKAMKVINLMNVRGFLLMISENSTELKQQTREKQRCLYPDKSTITSFCIYFLIFLPHYERLIMYTAVINRIYADGSLFDSETLQKLFQNTLAWRPYHRIWEQDKSLYNRYDGLTCSTCKRQCNPLKNMTLTEYVVLKSELVYT